MAHAGERKPRRTDEFPARRRSSRVISFTTGGEWTVSEPETVPPMSAAENRQRWVALVVLCVGMLMIVLDATDVLPAIVLLGTGVGVCFPALATLAMSGATDSDAGLASGLINTTTQVGAALGLAVLATLSATRHAGLAKLGVAQIHAATGGGRPGVAR